MTTYHLGWALVFTLWCTKRHKRHHKYFHPICFVLAWTWSHKKLLKKIFFFFSDNLLLGSESVDRTRPCGLQSTGFVKFPCFVLICSDTFGIKQDHIHQPQPRPTNWVQLLSWMLLQRLVGFLVWLLVEELQSMWQAFADITSNLSTSSAAALWEQQLGGISILHTNSYRTCRVWQAFCCLSLSHWLRVSSISPSLSSPTGGYPHAKGTSLVQWVGWIFKKSWTST